MLKRRSGGHELGELVNTTCNTCRTRTWILTVLHSLTSTNQRSRMCPSPWYPSFPRMTWWKQSETGTWWLRFSSGQSDDESHGAHRPWISTTHRCPTPRSCSPRHAAAWKYALPSFAPAEPLSSCFEVYYESISILYLFSQVPRFFFPSSTLSLPLIYPSSV